MFRSEIAAALRAYERHIVCLEKTPEECQAVLHSLVEKAIHAYVTRAPGLHHGLGVDKHLTVILSETNGDRPLCGIYFNLRSPYLKKSAPKVARATG
jgi:hypothetical protein